MSEVPFVDLRRGIRAIRPALDAAMAEVVDSAAFVGGAAVARFEERFARFCGTAHAVGVASGTDALLFALIAAGVQPGDEVVTVPNTFIATAEAIVQAGARVVFADVDPATLALDPARLERAITPRTRAVVPVHLFGRPADMEAIGAIARARGVEVVEDACQAHGSRAGDKRAGALGRAAAFSFYPGKNLGAFGEAGAVTTDDAALAARCRMLRDHGQREKYVHELSGWNGRLDAIQAAVLSVKLDHLEAGNARRKGHAALYRELLAGAAGVALPCPDTANVVGNEHLFVVRLRSRDAVARALRERGVVTGVHYPVPLHLQQAYRGLGYREGDFPAAEAACREVLSLPMFPELEEAEVHRVASELRTATAGFYRVS